MLIHSSPITVTVLFHFNTALTLMASTLPTIAARCTAVRPDRLWKSMWAPPPTSAMITFFVRSLLSVTATVRGVSRTRRRRREIMQQGNSSSSEWDRVEGFARMIKYLSPNDEEALLFYHPCVCHGHALLCRQCNLPHKS